MTNSFSSRRWQLKLVASITIMGMVVAACASAADDTTTTATGSGEDPGATTTQESGSGDEPTSTNAPSTENVAVSFLNWFYDGTMKEAYDGYIESFVSENPSVVAVDVETQPFPRYHDVLNVRLSANQPPEVAWINASVGPQYVNSGRLVDLMPFIEQASGFNLEDYPEEALAPWMNGDELVALPFTNANNVLYFNEDVFAEAAVSTPIELQEQGDWTWETLKESAKQLVDSGAAEVGFYFNNNIYTNGWRNLIEVYAPYGAGPWSEDGTECTFNSPETIEATQLVWDMVYVDGSHPEPSVTVDFAAGDVGMTLARQNYVPRLAEVPFGWDVTIAPEGPEGYVPSLAQNGIAAWAEAESPDQGAAFVVHTVMPENAAAFSINTPSPRRSLQNLETLTQFDTGFTDDQLERAVIPSLQAKDFELEYYHPQYAPVERESQVVFDSQVWLPDANIEEAMNAVCSNIQPLLAP